MRDGWIILFMLVGVALLFVYYSQLQAAQNANQRNLSFGMNLPF